MTMTAISEGMSHSRERVRQIVRKAGVSPEESRKATREAQRRARKRQYASMRKPRTTIHCSRCAAAFEVIEGRERGFCSSACRTEQKKVDLLAHLRALAADLGYTPAQRDINAVSGPWHTQYHEYFGSLREAQRLAGLEPNDVGGPGHIDRA
jgi:hypothetical protein